MTKSIDYGTLTDQSASYNAALGLNNPEGSTKKIENILYKDNKVTSKLISSATSSSNAHRINTYGGVIYNEGEITSITGAFINNSIDSIVINDNEYSSNNGYGAAICNRGTIGDITADFVGNSSSSGSAIYNQGTIADISGNFIGNSGDTIYNSGIIRDITGYFIGNSGGTIHNSRTIGDIKGYFIGNSDGTIYNAGTIGDITGDFIGNTQGSAIENSEGHIGNIKGNFIGNISDDKGGAIYNNSYHIGDISSIGDITANFIKNKARVGGAISNSSEYQGRDFIIGTKDENGNIVGGIVNSNFIGNEATLQGGAIYTENDLNIIAKDNGQSIFTDNSPDAIYVGNLDIGETKTNIKSIDYNNVIYEGNTTLGDKYNPENNPVLTLNANTNGVIYFDDKISGDVIIKNGVLSAKIIGIKNTFPAKEEMYAALGLSDDASLSEVVDAYIAFIKNQYNEDLSEQQALSDLLNMGAIETSDPELISGEITAAGYNLKITGDSTGKVVLNNDVINANISLDSTNLYLGREDVFDKSVSLSLNSGSIYLNNQSVGTMHVPTLNLNGNTNISVDADLANKSMDRITADNYNVKDGAKLNVNNIVLLSDSTEDVTNIQFADDGLAANVAYTGASPIAYSPIWKYDVSYNPDDGFFSFARGSAGDSGSYNPSVLASPVATQTGAYITQLQTFNYAFQHADSFMNIPYMERLSIINSGRYALSPTGDATDVGTFSPLLLKDDDAGFWVKPYASFENVPLKNGPKVSNINYGTLVGYDSKLTSVGNGFERVLTGYIGYNGASQRYSGVDAYQNGGLLGGTATFYKGNFFNATTLSVGASAGDASTMYGSENYTMLLAGLGNKTGYNFEFFDGGMILQPSMLISYTFVNTFDYNNAAGVRIESDPMHAIQLAPGIKLIGNTKNGWQPYIGVSMVWNLLDESKVTADSVRLPEMSIKPYVQYGVGIQKRFKDKFLAFGQAMIHNGGRNGVSLSGGLRWIVGRE